MPEDDRAEQLWDFMLEAVGHGSVYDDAADALAVLKAAVVVAERDIAMSGEALQGHVVPRC